MIKLENLGLSASVNPMSVSYTSDWFEYPGYFRKPAHCQLEVYRRESGEGYAVVIATELENNDGASITNASESLATVVCKQFDIHPSELILIEHYPADTVIKEDRYSLVKFSRKWTGKGWNDFSDRDWFPLEKPELERLLGAEVF